MIGLGYRREMHDWPLPDVQADFFEVVPENWLRRDRSRLHDILASGRRVHLHGVSLNLGGQGAFDLGFLHALRDLLAELGQPHFSDHLAASGDAHQLYDLFPIPFTLSEAHRVADRILQVQDVLGRRIAVENSSWYTNVGEMSEMDFINTVLARADCQLLLDINNLDVNHKNHGGSNADAVVRQLPLQRVSYVHVAGHEFDARFGMHIDTHSEPVASNTVALARQLQAEHGLAVLLEWDNDVPDMARINQELACLRSTPM